MSETIYTGRIDITIKDLTISIFSNGYSLNDLEKENLQQKFDSPFNYEDIDNYKVKLENVSSKYSDSKSVIETIQRNKANIATCKEHLTSLFKKYNSTNELKIEVYEPPLTLKDNKININETNAIELYLPSDQDKDTQEDIFSYALRFQENAIYYIELNSKNYDVQLSRTRTSPQGTLIPYKGSSNGWTLNFRNQLFYGEICIFKNDNKNNPFFTFPILVFPRKLEPQESMEIVEDLLKLHGKLIIDYSSGTGLTIQPGDIGEKSPLQKLKFIDYIWTERRLDKALQSIIDNPHKTLITEEIGKNIDEVGIVSPYRIVDMITDSQGVMTVKSGGHFKVRQTSFAFTKAYDEVVKVSYDTYPNKFVKFFLNYLYMDLQAIIEILQSNNNGANDGIYKNYYAHFLKRANEIKNKYVIRFMSQDFFKEVSDLKHLTIPPQTLLKEDRYQTVFTSFQELLKGVIADDDLEQMLRDPIANMPELYEYWCFLKIRELIKQLKGEDGKENFETNESNGKTIISKWEIKWDKTVVLTYQKKVSAKNTNGFYSYSVPFIPDIFLEINNSVIIFDAKYRVDFIEEIEKVTSDEKAETELYEKINEIKRAERRGEYKLDDLYKMHTYREAIIRNRQNGNLEKPLWVIALYPGNNENALYYEKRKIKSIDINKEKELMTPKQQLFLSGGVGAIPLRPESEDMNNQACKELLRSFLQGEKGSWV